MSVPARSMSSSIDLTGDEPGSKSPVAKGSLLNISSQPIDLTVPHDHMHAVVELLRPTRRALDLLDTSPKPRKKRKLDIKASPSRLGKSHTSELSERDEHQEQSSLHPPTACQALQGLQYNPSRHSDSPSSLILSPTRQSSPLPFTCHNHRKSRETVFKAFPFMEFPPEIRNSVYRMLLTTGPIELPELTGRNGAAHRSKWAKCVTAKQKKQHKTIFLEILECSKQIHDEASGILYGCNVFKYRSALGDGAQRVVLPTRHLQLLKHIKISVISGARQISQQDQTVANLVRQFAKDALKLETFELTWFGQTRYHLQKDSNVGQALRILNVQKSFLIKVAGEARMQKAMQEDLETVLRSRKIEIHRPVKAVTGEELSDAEGT